jgi:F-type H+-transporting ATPase subunit delta
MVTGSRGGSVARNYAEALLELARKAEDAAGWGTMLRQVSDAIGADRTLQRFLDSPRISADAKADLLARALGDRTPRFFLRFLQALVRNRRQALIPAIADEYDALLDVAEGIVHARVTVARALTDDDRSSIAAQLSRFTGKTVVPQVMVDPDILGGVIVRMGDTVMDGSLRRRLGLLRRRMAARPVA